MIRIVVLLCLLAGQARADNASLVAARKAIEDVRYDDARRLLVEALQRGTSSPDQVREIYRLSAATAQVLGQSDLAEQYYRRLLALEPDAKLPADASPKLRDPFVAAQAYMAAQGRLDATAIETDHKLTVKLVSDPLNMVASVSSGEDAKKTTPLSTSEPSATLAGGAHEVQIRDEHGNTLAIVAVKLVAAAVAPPPPERPPPTTTTPVLARWQTWAITGGVFAVAGAGFAIDAQRSKAKLDDILANDDMHFFDEAEDQRRRWKRDTIIAGVSFGVAGALAVTAVVLAVKHRGVTTAVTPRSAAVAVRF